MTDPIVSWAITKETIEELWVRRTRACAANAELVDMRLVVLMTGWNIDKTETQMRVAAKWREVKARWCRELAEMSECAIDIDMLQLNDRDGLNALSQFGTRLFVAI